MAYVARYLTHPQVMVDPEVPVTEWGLSPAAHARIERLLCSQVLIGTTRVVSSAERKAIETAEPIAEALGVATEIRPLMHENDRSSTGYLPREEFESVADRFFAEPTHSIRGWERAIDAQQRIVAEVESALSQTRNGDVLFVGHGAVGTLLRCWLARLPIDRKHDQPGGKGGCIFTLRISDKRVLSDWCLMEDLLRP